MGFFDKFLGLFSYRQRFLIAVMAYVLCIPYPTYVIVQMFHFWSRQYEWEIAGDNIQKRMNHLVSDIQKRQLGVAGTTPPIEGSNRVKDIDTEIDEHFNALLLYQKRGPANAYRLGAGFSVLSTPYVDVEPLYKLWNTLLLEGEKGQTAQQKDSLYQQIQVGLKAELLRVGYSYALFQGDTLSGNSYSSLVLDKLPEIEEKVKELILKSQAFADRQKEASLHYQVIALHEFVRRGLGVISSLFNAFHQAMGERENLSIAELKSAKKSFENFVETLSVVLNRIADGQSVDLKDKNYFSAIALAKNNLIYELYLLQHAVYENELSQNNTRYYWFLAELGILMFLMWFIVKFRGLSAHLIAMRDHIMNLSQGKLSYCVSINQSDEFGKVGIALDKVVDALRIIIADLLSFSDQIHDITAKVAWAIKEQEASVIEQEKTVIAGKKTAQDIAERSLFLSNLLNDMCESSQLLEQAKGTHMEIKKNRENMDFLLKASERFLTMFDSFSEAVKNTQKQVNFMDRLGDQAQMLSLNGKIENASITESAANFSEITTKIGRFSDNSEEATSQIKSIIKVALTGVKSVKTEAQRCLREISGGVGRLTLVSTKLEEIARLGEGQQQQFSKVDEMMKEQAGSSQRIINTVKDLLVPTNQNVEMVHELPKILESIVQQEKKLREVVGSMEFIP